MKELNTLSAELTLKSPNYLSYQKLLSSLEKFGIKEEVEAPLS